MSAEVTFIEKYRKVLLLQGKIDNNNKGNTYNILLNINLFIILVNINFLQS